MEVMPTVPTYAQKPQSPVTRVYASTITVWLFYLFLPPGVSLPERKPVYVFELLLYFIHNFSKFLSRKDTYPCALCLFAVSWVMSYTWVFWLLLEQGPWLISLGPHTMPNVWKVWLASFPFAFWLRMSSQCWAIHSCIVITL